MNRWFNKILLFISCIFIGLTSFGFSFWYFSAPKEAEDNIETSFKIDDIKENYRFGKTGDEKRYTLYLFPSAAYMFLYGRYLEDSSNEYGTHYLPEEEFGYKEVLTNETGNVLTDNNGKALFKLSENTGKYDSKVSYDGAYKLFLDHFFNYDNSFEVGGNGSSSTTNDIYSYSKNKYGRDYGLPTDGFTFSTNNNDLERYNSRDLFSRDRLGCWEDSYYYGNSLLNGSSSTGSELVSYAEANETNTGRYLPIKITVTNTLSIDLLSKVVGGVFSSMGDSVKWYNFSFTNWTYVSKDTSTNSYFYPYSWRPNSYTTDSFKPVGEAFSAKDINRTFDIFEDLDKYADENGVIRLFPLFSNGKKYHSGSYEDGGGDAFKLVGNYKDSTKKPTYKYFMPSSERINEGNGNFNGTNIPNSEIRYYSYDYLSLKKNHNYSDLSIFIDWVRSGSATWKGDWANIYKLDLNFLNNELINKYGDGLYNFYLFQGNYKRTSGQNINYDDFYNKIINEATGENGFNSLKGKSIHLINLSNLIQNFGEYNKSPVVFGIEKIGDPKIISDFDLKENGTNLSYESIDKLDDYILEKSVTAHGFTRLETPLYGRNGEINNYTYSSNNLNERNPYTYIAKNVNFMNAKTNYFMIAFSDVFISNINIHLYNADYNSVINNPTISGTEYTYNPEDVFLNASEYIKNVEFITENDGKKYLMFSFNNDEDKGLYDMLLIYESNNAFGLYFYRHTNLFCKVFDKDLVETTDNFINHDEANLAKNGINLIFKKKYFLGLNMRRDNKNEVEGKDETLEEAIINYTKNKYGTSYDESYLTKVRLVDHVTQTIIAKFELNNSTNAYELICSQKIYKNYVFYLSYSA